MKKLTLALLAAALLGTGVSFADNPPASGTTAPAATDTAKKPAGKKHSKKSGKKGSKKGAKDTTKSSEQPK